MTKTRVDVSVNDEALVAALVDAAIANGAAIDSGDYRTANRHHDAGTAFSDEIRRRGPSTGQRLLPLLTHENPWVRYWAATEVIKFAPSEAEAVLEDLAVLPAGLVRLSAETMLSEWRKTKPALS